MKTYALPLAIDYVAHWGVVEAVRELLQNAIDSDSPFECQFAEGSMRITSRGVKLEPKTLLLGVSTKCADSSKIGSFGEGYKLALLVLARQGKDVAIFNGDSFWRPRLAYSEDFECVQLFIDTEESFENPGLTFDIAGLTDAEIASIKESCLLLSPFNGEVIEGTAGSILVDLPSRLYVNSLFVCNTGLKHSYNFKPKYLKLERDRQTVADFDLKWQTSDLWSKAKKDKELATMVNSGRGDVTFITSTSILNDNVKNLCYKDFMLRNPGAIIARDQRHKSSLEAQGYSNVVIACSDSEFDAVSTSPLQQARGLIIVAKPNQVLKTYFEKNKQYMRKHAIVATKHLIKASESWS